MQVSRRRKTLTVTFERHPRGDTVKQRQNRVSQASLVTEVNIVLSFVSESTPKLSVVSVTRPRVAINVLACFVNEADRNGLSREIFKCNPVTRGRG